MGKKGSGESKRVITQEFEGTTFNVSLPNNAAAQEVREFVESVGGSAFVYRGNTEYNAERTQLRNKFNRLLMDSARAAMSGDDAKADELKDSARLMASEYHFEL